MHKYSSASLIEEDSPFLIVREICSYLEKHYHEKMYVSDIAKLFNFSERQINRIFRNETGLSIIQRVHQIRISKAKALLSRTNDKIISIAASIGYEDPSFFNRLFHRQVGCSPRRYRFMCRGTLESVYGGNVMHGGKPMARLAFLIQVKPGSEDEYKERHRSVWPEVTEALKKHGVRSYSIFQHNNTLFAYMIIDGDAEQMFQKLHEDPASCKWRDYMSDIVIRNEHMGFHFIEEVFHLD
jgi:L-rhamnose mutarotase/AraC-like DNA-binding protein